MQIINYKLKMKKFYILWYRSLKIQSSCSDATWVVACKRSLHISLFVVYLFFFSILSSSFEVNTLDSSISAPYSTFLFDAAPVISNIQQIPSNPYGGEDIIVTTDVYQPVERASLPVEKVILSYSKDSGKNWITIEMNKDIYDKSRYYGIIPTQKEDEDVIYYISAYDEAGNIATEMPGKIMEWSEDGKIPNMIGVSDTNEENKTVPQAIDFTGLKVGYDEQNFYVQMEFDGKPAAGNFQKEGAFYYLAPLLNLSKSRGAGDLLNENTSMVIYSPLLASMVGIPKYGVVKFSEVLSSKKGKTNLDVKFAKTENKLTFRFPLSVIGDNPEKKILITGMSGAVTNPSEGFYPWDVTPYITVYLQHHTVKIEKISSLQVQQLRAGAYELDITPPVGTPLAGYGDRKGEPSKGIHDLLMAEALVLENDGRKYAFVSLDFFYMRGRIFNDIANAVEKKTGISRYNLFISASHSHSSSGGLLPELELLSGRPNQKGYDTTIEKIVKCIVEADSRLKPAKIGFGEYNLVADEYLSRNRRENNGPLDPQILVMRVDDMQNKPLAVYFNFTAHPTVLGGSNKLFSADYVGAAKNYVRKNFRGAVPFFVNGAIGNQGPNCPDNCGKDDFEKVERIGTLLGEKVVKTADKIKTKDTVNIYSKVRFILFASKPRSETFISAISIDNVLFTTIPGEGFVELGLDIKKTAIESGWENAFILGLTNDGLGYIMPETWFHKHPYEATFAIFGAKEGDFILGQIKELVKEMKNNQLPQDKHKVKRELPQNLPYEIPYKDEETPLTQEEIDAFTVKMMDFWKRTDFFRWVLRISHGVDVSTGLPDYQVWWHDIEAQKEGDIVTFRHSKRGGGHNVMIPTTQLLSQVSAGYLLTGDKTMGEITKQFSKGVAATMKGMLWDKDDKVQYLMARNIIPNNHSYIIDGGRKKSVDYSLWRNTEQHWNTHRIHFPNNPYWGDIYLHNMRSKDDVPHIFHTAGFLSYVIAYGGDKDVVEAAREAYDYLQGFAKDIVDNGYHIRTKDEQGNPYIPKEDLSSFVDYENVAPRAECNAKLSAALIAYGENHGNNCRNGYGGLYEQLAVKNHFYNYKIIHGFHISAVLHSLIAGENEAAYDLLVGLSERADKLMKGKGQKQSAQDPRWKPDLAVFLLQAASTGMPLTSEQVRLIHSEYSRAIEQYKNFPRWDLWDKSIPDGTYGSDGGYLPNDDGLVRPEELAFFLEYCYSPFRSKAGKNLVNCEIIKNISKQEQQ